MTLSRRSCKTQMNPTLKHRLTQFWFHVQEGLFPFLHEMAVDLTPALKRVATVLEMLQIERFLCSARSVGRPAKDRVALARAFVAKATLNLPTTEALIDRLKVDQALRRLCGFSICQRMPGKHRFSRAFAEFADIRLAERSHEALIETHLGDQLIGHIARDSTAIAAREKPAVKPLASAPPAPRRRGRPRRGEAGAPKPETRLQRQQGQTLAQMMAELPRRCDTGTKQDSQGFKHSWIGYKLHLDTTDGDITVRAILTSASLIARW